MALRLAELTVYIILLYTVLKMKEKNWSWVTVRRQSPTPIQKAKDRPITPLQP